MLLAFLSSWVHCQAFLSDEVRRLPLSQMLPSLPQLPVLFLSSHSKFQEAALLCENSVIKGPSFIWYSQQFRNAWAAQTRLSNYGQIWEAKQRGDCWSYCRTNGDLSGWIKWCLPSIVTLPGMFSACLSELQTLALPALLQPWLLVYSWSTPPLQEWSPAGLRLSTSQCLHSSQIYHLVPTSPIG